MTSNNLIHRYDQLVESVSAICETLGTVIATTSFGYQSALTLHLANSLEKKPLVLFVESPLSLGTTKHREKLSSQFDLTLRSIDRTSWLREKTGGRDFMGLEEDVRIELCRAIKKEPLRDIVEKEKAAGWITGIRSRQTKNRKGISKVELCDLGISKVSPFFDWLDEDIERMMMVLGLPANHQHVDFCKMNRHQECGLHL